MTQPDNLNRIEELSIDNKISSKEKKIHENLWKVEWYLEKRQLATKLNEHFGFNKTIADIGKEIKEKQFMTTEEIQELLKKKYGSDESVKEFLVNYSLYLKLSETLYGTGSNSLDVSKTPMNGKIEDVYNALVFSAIWEILISTWAEVFLPEALPNDGMEVKKLWAVSSLERFTKAFEYIKKLLPTASDRRILIGQTTGNYKDLPKAIEAMTKSLDALAYNLETIIKIDPKMEREGKEARYFYDNFIKIKWDYNAMIPESLQNARYMNRLNTLNNSINKIQDNAWESFYTEKYFLQWESANKSVNIHNNVFDVLLSDDFVVPRDILQKKWFETAIQKNIAIYVQDSVKQWGMGKALRELDNMHLTIDKNNIQSPKLQEFYQLLSKTRHESLAAEIGKNTDIKSRYEHRQIFFSTITGRDPEKWISGAGSKRIDDYLKDMETADEQLIKMSEEGGLFELLAQKNKKEMWFPTQEEFDSLKKKYAIIKIINAGLVQELDLLEVLGLSRETDINTMTIAQLAIYKNLDNISKKPELSQLYPNKSANPEDIRLDKIQSLFESEMTKVQKLLAEWILGILGNNVEGMSKEQQELLYVMRDFHGTWWFNLSDANRESIKEGWKFVLVLWATIWATVATWWLAAMATGSAMGIVWSAVSWAVAGTVAGKLVYGQGADTYSEWAWDFGSEVVTGTGLNIFGMWVASKFFRPVSMKNLMFWRENWVKWFKETMKNIGINMTTSALTEWPVSSMVETARQTFVLEQDFDYERAVIAVGHEVLMTFAFGLMMHWHENHLAAQSPKALKALQEWLSKDAAKAIPSLETALKNSTDSKQHWELEGALENWKKVKKLNLENNSSKKASQAINETINWNPRNWNEHNYFDSKFSRFGFTKQEAETNSQSWNALPEADIKKNIETQLKQKLKLADDFELTAEEFQGIKKAHEMEWELGNLTQEQVNAKVRKLYKVFEKRPAEDISNLTRGCMEGWWCGVWDNFKDKIYNNKIYENHSYQLDKWVLLNINLEKSENIEINLWWKKLIIVKWWKDSNRPYFIFDSLNKDEFKWLQYWEKVILGREYNSRFTYSDQVSRKHIEITLNHDWTLEIVNYWQNWTLVKYSEEKVNKKESDNDNYWKKKESENKREIPDKEPNNIEWSNNIQRNQLEVKYNINKNATKEAKICLNNKEIPKPEFEITIQWQTFLVSKPFTDPSWRSWIMWYSVTSNGIEPRFYYFSWSGMNWHSTPGNREGYEGYSKWTFLNSYDYEKWTLINQELSNYFNRIPKSWITTNDDLLWYITDDIWRAYINERWKLTPNNNVAKSFAEEIYIYDDIVKSVDRSYFSWEWDSYSSLKKTVNALDIVNAYNSIEKNLQDYLTLDSNTTNTRWKPQWNITWQESILDNIEYKKVSWTFKWKPIEITYARSASNEPDLIWVESINFANSEISSLWIDKEKINWGILTAKPLEYPSQTPDYIRNSKTSKMYWGYYDIRGSIQSNPLIKMLQASEVVNPHIDIFNDINESIWSMETNNIISYDIWEKSITFQKINNSWEVKLIHSDNKDLNALWKTWKIVLTKSWPAFIYTEWWKNKWINIKEANNKIVWDYLFQNISKSSLKKVLWEKVKLINKWENFEMGININEAKNVIDMLWKINDLSGAKKEVFEYNKKKYDEYIELKKEVKYYSDIIDAMI